MRKTDKTIKLEKKLVEYLKKRGRWTTSRNFVEAFEEIKSRNSARRTLRRCKDIREIKHPRNKRQYMYGLPEWPKPTKTSVDAHI